MSDFNGCSDDDNSLNLDLAMEVADYFRVETKRATEIIDRIRGVVNSWRLIASKYGLSRREQEIISPAFD